MHQDKPEWIAHQRRRFTRPDGERYIRHDAYRVMPPGAPRHVGKDVVRYCEPGQADRKNDRLARVDDDTDLRDLSAERGALLRLRSELAAIKAALKFRRLLRTSKANFNPNQPRVPAGNPDGGQWITDGPGPTQEPESDPIRVAQIENSVTDADGTPYYKPGGHHEMPKGVYNKWNLRPETRRVFEQATTGKVPSMFLRTTPDGVPVGNFWNGPNGAHGIYNEAVQQLSERFLDKNAIKAENMTPDQARVLLKEIRESEDPRIRNFNGTMRFLRRLFPLRTGRGTE
jgi:hypothetical protein